jgi:hypothetical protein
VCVIGRIRLGDRHEMGPRERCSLLTVASTRAEMTQIEFPDKRSVYRRGPG